MNILFDTFFTTDANGHGGNHRTAQISELLEKANIHIARLDRTILTTKLSRYLAGVQAVANINTIRFVLKHRLKINPSFVSLAFCGFQRQLYYSKLRQHPGKKLLVWEATKNYVVPYVAEEVGFKVVAVPHNLESLVPDQDSVLENLETEVEALAKSDVVFCISREEEWFLRIRGVNAYFLPYYPPALVLERLFKVRKARLNASKNRFLILGNANNPPTKQGMIEQINWLKQVSKTLEFQVDIVGYGTEKLVDACDRQNFTLHGSVPSEELNQFLIGAQAALVHQTPTSGALTRIPELLIAGVPVIANSNACRSTFEYSGIYCYDDQLELTDLMSQSLATPEILPRPIAAEKRFLDYLSQLA